MRLIDPSIVTYSGRVTDAQLKDRLLAEAIEQAGCAGPDGKPLKGVSAVINRDGGRSGSGAWVVTVTRDISKSGHALIAPPSPDQQGGKA